MTEDAFVVPIESSHVLQFARALGYEDEHRQTPPPTFLVAADTFDPHFDRRPRTDRAWFGEGDGREQKGASGFHARTAFVFHRSIEVGEQLSAVPRIGDVINKAGRRGGSLTFTDRVTDFVDAAGEVVATVTWTNVSTSVEVTG